VSLQGTAQLSLLICSNSPLFRHEGRTWYTAHRGRLWIAAASKAPTKQEIHDAEHMYEILKGGGGQLFLYVGAKLGFSL